MGIVVLSLIHLCSTVSCRRIDGAEMERGSAHRSVVTSERTFCQAWRTTGAIGILMTCVLLSASKRTKKQTLKLPLSLVIILHVFPPLCLDARSQTASRFIESINC